MLNLLGTLTYALSRLFVATDGPTASATTTIALQSVVPMTIPMLDAWAGTVSVTSVGSSTLTIAVATMTAPTAVLTTTSGVTAVIASGTVQGALRSTATSTQTITASVVAGTNVTISGVSLFLNGGGVLTAVGTGAVSIGSGVTIATHTLAGAGPFTLDGCTVNSAAVISATGPIRMIDASAMFHTVTFSNPNPRSHV
jgi:hypothetical protein